MILYAYVVLSFSRTLKRIKPFSRISLDLSLNGTFALILLRSLLYHYWVLCPGDPSYWVSLTRSIFALWQSIIHVGSMIGPCLNLEFESTNFLPFLRIFSVQWNQCPDLYFGIFVPLIQCPLTRASSGDLHFQLLTGPSKNWVEAGN